MKYASLVMLIMLTFKTNPVFSAVSDEFNISGQVSALEADAVDVKESSGKVIVIPKAILHGKIYRTGDLVELHLTQSEFNQVKLKSKTK